MVGQGEMPVPRRIGGTPASGPSEMSARQEGQLFLKKRYTAVYDTAVVVPAVQAVAGATPPTVASR